MIKRELIHAGYYGRYANLDNPIPAPPATPNPCATDLASLRVAAALPIQGYDAPTGKPLPCLSDSNHIDGTDILVIRRASPIQTTGSLSPSRVYLQSNAMALRLDSGDGSFDLTDRFGLPSAIREYYVDIYFISPCLVTTANECTADADGGNPIPTLKRLRLSSNGVSPVFTEQPMIEGVENLQFDFGLDTTEDGIVDPPYVTAPLTPPDWADVIALQAFVLARSIGPDAGAASQRTYHLGLAGSFGPFADRVLRHSYATSMRLMNVAGRRELP
ncbi:MAG: PilW family protein [Salinisphaeraceae bacterium]